MRLGAGALSLLLLSCLFALPAAAEQPCTEIGCVNGLTIDLAPDLFEEEGIYEIRLVLDGRMVQCKGVLPLRKCEEGPSFRCNAKDVRISESGCALPEDQHTIPNLMIDGLPRKIMMSVEHGNVMQVTRTFRPTYLTSRPNGPLCEPTCIQSRVLFSRDRIDK